MKVIVGLGNPEKEYSKTRHNMGFNVINLLADNYNIDVNKNKFKALYGDGFIEGIRVLLVKPQTYMNLSGESVIEIMNFYKVDLEDLIVIYDDLDIEPGKIRIRKSGSPGTHNGMKSIYQHLKSNDFPRVRVGIGKPELNQNLIDYVIGKIDLESQSDLDEGCKKANDAVVEMITNGIDKAMNKFN